MKSKLLISVFFLSFFLLPGAHAEELPPPETGYKKLVIPAQKDPNEPYNTDEVFEVATGKIMEIDCNSHWIWGAKLTKKELKGGMGSYYVYERTEEPNPHDKDGDNIGATARGCKNPHFRSSQWVSGPTLRFYEPVFSELVIYVPNHLSVRFRRWVPESSKFYIIKQ